jgi:XTP/dITP diphosphohydrolase
MEQKLQAFSELLTIMDDLRAKCPWDMKQTNESLRHLTIEEVYELSDAILDGDSKGIKEELGDILLHIVFYAKLGEEKGEFDIASLTRSICKKLIDRHPHIYGNTVVADEEEVKKNWEQLKLKEGRTSILGGVPKGLPALVKAYRIQEKVKQVGFEWEHKEQVWDKVQEEMNELNEAIASQDQEHMEEEFGDLMFTMVNYARFLNIEPEAALERCNIKFIKRFKYMEEQAKLKEIGLKEMSLEDMELLWQEAKHKA